MEPEQPTYPLIMIEEALWWNFQRFCRIHGYVTTAIPQTGVVFIHRPTTIPPPTLPFLPPS